ncbi:archaetidylinositol phosphate synthase [Pyrococcus sp. ST04]|uniref:archaetidylinositol phosphate synthase n=1 Tax=Pyrococcus sp. ST04 TaxID=1183377 RepID=UPI00026058E4|nr:archaetidylinositol phosphate synthase [Pyrococcus sp. ST04]AFK22244.1 CDP-diacylglycerol-glycerol-3-phosphate 3-phosphatidyltransferase [Pyrococcus sp. ST04]
MLSRIRPIVKEPLEKIAKPLARAGLTPNQLTVFGLLLTLLAGYEFYLGNQRLAGIILIVGAFLDALDGSLARLTGKVTKFGGFLDSTLDRVSDGAILFGIATGGLADWRIVFMALIGSYMVSYTRCRAELAGSGSLAVGIAERGERLIILIISALLGFVKIGVYLVTVLAWITFIQRISEAKKRLE